MSLAYPNLIDASGYYISLKKKSYAIWLWTNSGAYGVVQFEFYNSDTKNVISRGTCCYPTKVGLKYLTTIEITSTEILNFYDLKVFRCNSDTEQTCPPDNDPKCYGACRKYIRTGSMYDIPIRRFVTTKPSAPTGLAIISGDKKLTISWNPVTNTDIFAYYIRIKRGAYVIVDGYTRSDERSVTINDLSNGLTYDVLIQAVSHSRIYGSIATGKGTPNVACQVPSINMVII